MIVIALGSNLPSAAGSPQQTLLLAFSALPAYGIEILTCSSFYRSPAWPDPSDPPFINAVAIVGSRLPPGKVMAALHRVESVYGRIRTVRNAPRTLDLDLLDYDGKVEAGPPVLPHPRLAERAFVLVPLAEVAPDWVHPVTGQDVRTLLAQLSDESRATIARLEAPGAG